MRLLYGVVQADDMFQQKVDILQRLAQCFGITDNILIVNHADDGRDHDSTLR